MGKDISYAFEDAYEGQEGRILSSATDSYNEQYGEDMYLQSTNPSVSRGFVLQKNNHSIYRFE